VTVPDLEPGPIVTALSSFVAADQGRLAITVLAR
jgi:hypothetical protein